MMEVFYHLILYFNYIRYSVHFDKLTLGVESFTIVMKLHLHAIVKNQDIQENCGILCPSDIPMCKRESIFMHLWLVYQMLMSKWCHFGYHDEIYAYHRSPKSQVTTIVLRKYLPLACLSIQLSKWSQSKV